MTSVSIICYPRLGSQPYNQAKLHWLVRISVSAEGRFSTLDVC